MWNQKMIERKIAPTLMSPAKIIRAYKTTSAIALQSFTGTFLLDIKIQQEATFALVT